MHGDVNELIASNTGLIFKQLKKFNLLRDPEAESIGYEALYNAIVDYDSTKGTQLSTLATVYIYNALGSYVRTLNKQRQLQIISYNNIAYTDDNEAHEFLDILAVSVDTEKDYLRQELHKLTREAFNNLYDKLTNSKHKVILELWRDSEFTATTTEIAKQVGVSQSYVSQVINNFKFNLRKKLEDVYYD